MIQGFPNDFLWKQRPPVETVTARLRHLHGVGQALGWATGHLQKLSVDMEIQKRKERKEKEVNVYI